MNGSESVPSDVCEMDNWSTSCVDRPLAEELQAPGSYCGFWKPALTTALCLPGDTWTETLAYVMFWGAASAITATIILFNGQDFVDAPKLVHKEKMDWVCVSVCVHVCVRTCVCVCVRVRMCTCMWGVAGPSRLIYLSIFTDFFPRSGH